MTHDSFHQFGAIRVTIFERPENHALEEVLVVQWTADLKERKDGAEILQGVSLPPRDVND